jgi:predicted dienelactone hydrolase
LPVRFEGVIDMRVKRFLIGLGAVLVAGGAMAQYVLTPAVHEGRTGEAPELGRPGAFRIGTSNAQIALPGRGRITAMSAVTGKLEAADRALTVRFWYPADAAAKGEPVRYDHVMRFPGKPPFPVASQGIAIADAKPLAAKNFPLVLMSHGYGGWNTQFSNLAEHIAAQGYVVAAINHDDMVADSLSSFVQSFANVLLDRSLDQRQVLTQIIAGVHARKAPYLDLVDPDTIGLIGYSMGAYGAIGTAGAPYRYDAGPLKNLPQAAREALQAASAQPPPIKSLVVFAPWGGQPDSRAWNEAGLARITLPVLLVAGNQDDVVNFKEGVSWLFGGLTGAERHMLVYREARHNIVGNEFELGEDDPFMAAEFLKEPVWRSDRLNTINQHFVTAFLDLTLKGQADKRAYLDLPTVDSNAGEWPTSMGEQLNGTMAGPEQDKYWRGFQRRWATGLKMHRAAPGKPR